METRVRGLFLQIGEFEQRFWMPGTGYWDVAMAGIQSHQETMSELAVQSSPCRLARLLADVVRTVVGSETRSGVNFVTNEEIPVQPCRPCLFSWLYPL
jgi:hypothetical protein